MTDTIDGLLSVCQACLKSSLFHHGLNYISNIRQLFSLIFTIFQALDNYLALYLLYFKYQTIVLFYILLYLKIQKLI